MFMSNRYFLSCSCALVQLYSPVVVDEGERGLGAGIGAGGGHTAVHVDPQRHVVTLQDGRLDVHHVTQEVHTRRPLRLPVL